MDTQLWQQIGAMALTGFIVSGVIQFAKQWIAKSAYKIMWTVLLSLGGGGILYAIQFIPASFLTISLGVLAAANTVYLIIIKPAEKAL